MRGKLSCRVCKDTPEYPTGMVEPSGFTCSGCLHRIRAERNRGVIPALALVIALTVIVLIAAAHLF